MNWITVVVVVAVLVVSCGDGGGDDNLVLTDTDSGSEVSLSAAQGFEVRLESNPGTGFRWELDDGSADAPVELVSRSFVEPEDAGVVGAAGTDVFVFRAGSEGAGVLRLEYSRPFDDPPVPERVAEFIVRIDGAAWPPAGVGDDPPSTSTASVPTDVSVLLAEPITGEVVVTGFIVWDRTEARLCEVLLESYPPQCGGGSIVITDPEELTMDLDTAEGVRWTPDRVDVGGFFDGTRLTLSP